MPIALLMPVPLKVAIDSGLGSQPLPPVLQAVVPFLVGDEPTRRPLILVSVAVILYVGLAALSHARGLALWLLSAHTGERLILRFRSDLFAHAQHLPLSYHDSTCTTQTLYRMYHDAPSIKHIPIDGTIPFLNACFMFTGTVYATLLIDWQLALVAIIVTPPLLLLTKHYSRKLRSQWSEVKAIEATNISLVQEVLGSYRLVKTFNTEAEESRRFRDRAWQCTNGYLRLAGLGSRFDFFTSMIMALGTAAVLFIGVQHVQHGLLTIGELLMVMAYLGQIYAPLDTATKKAAELQSALASVERCLALLDRQPEVMECTGGRSLARALGAVTFDRVSFSYDGTRPVLTDASFTIAPGTRVGVVGRTGDGKSTLMSLLTRLYLPTAGRILLDGIDVREYHLGDLRRQFAIVHQDPYLFSTTIAQNIAYSRPDASFDQIVAAAQAAHAHEFIVRLPDGYETMIGERGVRLSGGERQRLSLARAFLKDAPILILDEPTSALDVRTEALIVAAMEGLMTNRTTFLITHRLSTLKHCDVQLVLNQGFVTITDTVQREAADQAVLSALYDTPNYSQ